MPAPFDWYYTTGLDSADDAAATANLQGLIDDIDTVLMLVFGNDQAAIDLAWIANWRCKGHQQPGPGAYRRWTVLVRNPLLPGVAAILGKLGLSPSSPPRLATLGRSDDLKGTLDALTPGQEAMQIEQMFAEAA